MFAYAAGNAVFSSYLGIPTIAGRRRARWSSARRSPAPGIGFLWFNTYPAQVFMGDIGALALGGALGMLAVICAKNRAARSWAACSCIETVSVIIQVASFKLTGRRIFRMAPIHHHFELKGWAEPKVIVRFWIITVMLVLIGLASLKIR